MRARALVLLIGGATLAVNLALGVRWPAALLAGLAVLAVGEVTGTVLARTQTRGAAPRVAVTAEPAATGPAGVDLAQARAGPGAQHDQPLSRRELEVAVLVARGLRNKEIAHRLYISERTVDNHIQHSFNRLDLSSRVELATWVHRNGLAQEMSTGDE